MLKTEGLLKDFFQFLHDFTSLSRLVRNTRSSHSSLVDSRFMIELNLVVYDMDTLVLNIRYAYVKVNQSFKQELDALF
jgi:hypothetical protein